MTRAWRLMVFAVFATATPLAAQQGGLSVTPFVKYSSFSALYEHTIMEDRPNHIPFRSQDELEITEFASVGVEVGWPLSGRWLLFGSVDYGRPDYVFAAEDESNAQISEFKESGDASSLVVRVGVSRTVPFLTRTSLELRAAAMFARVDAASDNDECPAPSIGLSCSRPPVWREVYEIPGGSLGLAAVHRLTGRTALQIEASYSVGRVNTENFYSDLLPDFDQYEAPKSHITHALSLAAGVRIGF